MRSRTNLGEEPVRADDVRQLALQYLDADMALVPDVAREIHGRHSTDAELSLDAVPRQEGRRELRRNIGHSAILADRGGITGSALGARRSRSGNLVM